MKELDPSKLFDLFDKEEEIQEQSVDSKWISKDNPFILMGMIVRGVENFYILEEIHSNKNHKEDLNKQERRRVIKYSYYKSLYKYIQRINQNSMLDLEQCLIHDLEIIDLALNDIRTTFESYEEYEKCSTIRDLQENLQEVSHLINIEE